ncbi:MAG: DNA polymerase III subunit beta [bacterium]
MKIIGLQKNIKQGVFAVSNIAGKNNNLPILNNIVIQAVDGGIRFVSTNLEIGVTSTVRGKIEKEGIFTVDAKIFLDYINLLPNKKVELSVKDNNLEVNAENYQTKIKGQSADEYPLIPDLDKDNYFSLKISEFKKALSKVIFSVSTDENRLALSGVLFMIEEDNLTLVATDSYRLAEKTIKIKTNYQNNDEKELKKLIVPTKALQEVLRIVSGDYDDNKEVDDIKFYINDNQILFSFGSVEVVSRLIDEQYPDYKQIIPQNHKTTCTIEKQELTRAIKTSAIFSKTGINDINLDFLTQKQKTIISSISGQTGENVVNLDAKIEGLDNNITINYRYLLDGLNNMTSDLIRLEIIDSNTPALIKSEQDPTYLYIVMPIKK